MINFLSNKIISSLDESSSSSPTKAMPIETN
jgi:hypothetical protein